MPATLSGKWLGAPDINWEYMLLEGANLPAIGVRYNTVINQWEIGMYGNADIWTPYPNIKDEAEAKATAIAMWQTQ